MRPYAVAFFHHLDGNVNICLVEEAKGLPTLMEDKKHEQHALSLPSGKESNVILYGIPRSVQRFFAPIRPELSRPIANSLPVMVLAFLLAPARRCLKTVAGAVLGRREHASTISRRLRNVAWRTRDWFVSLYNHLLEDVHRWERRAGSQRSQRKRAWMAVVDTTYHSTHSEQMENLIVFNRSRDPNRRQVRHHAFVMGLLITEYGMRIPLPRRSYYTQEYCRQHHRRYRTQGALAAAMLQEIRLPEDVDVTVVFDSAFDAKAIHRVCRGRG